MEIDRKMQVDGKAFEGFVEMMRAYRNALREMMAKDETFVGRDHFFIIKSLIPKVRDAGSFNMDMLNMVMPDFFRELGKGSGIEMVQEGTEVTSKYKNDEQALRIDEINRNIHSAGQKIGEYLHYFSQCHKDNRDEFLSGYIKYHSNSYKPADQDKAFAMALSFLQEKKFMLPEMEKRPELKDHLIFSGARCIACKSFVVHDEAFQSRNKVFADAVKNACASVDAASLVKRYTGHESLDNMWEKELYSKLGHLDAENIRQLVNANLSEISQMTGLNGGDKSIYN